MFGTLLGFWSRGYSRRRRGAAARSVKPRHVRPELEVLEDRRVPASWAIPGPTGPTEWGVLNSDPTSGSGYLLHSGQTTVFRDGSHLAPASSSSLDDNTASFNSIGIRLNGGRDKIHIHGAVKPITVDQAGSHSIYYVGDGDLSRLRNITVTIHGSGSDTLVVDDQRYGGCSVWTGPPLGGTLVIIHGSQSSPDNTVTINFCGIRSVIEKTGRGCNTVDKVGGLLCDLGIPLEQRIILNGPTQINLTVTDWSLLSHVDLVNNGPYAALNLVDLSVPAQPLTVTAATISRAGVPVITYHNLQSISITTAAAVDVTGLAPGTSLTISGPGRAFVGGPLTVGAGSVFTVNTPYSQTGSLTIQGTVVLNGGGSSSGPITNAGTLIIGGGGTAGTAFTVSGAYAQTGALNVQAGDTLILTGPFANLDRTGTLTGGSYLIAGSLRLPNAAIFTDSADLVLAGNGEIGDTAGGNALARLSSVAATGGLALQGGAALAVTGDLRNVGTVRVDAGSALAVGGSYLQTAGSTLLDGTLAAQVLTWLQGGILSGTGTVNGNLRNAASILIGTAASAGTLTVTGDYTQTSAGELTVKVGGPNPGTDFDQLVVGGSATLNGTLTVRLVNGFAPDSGSAYAVLTCASEVGQFATLDGDGALFTVAYDLRDVTLIAN